MAGIKEVYRGGSGSVAIRQQFMAICNIVGDVKLAKELAPKIIITNTKQWPTDNSFDGWALRAAEGELPPKSVEDSVRRRLYAAEEWGNRRAIRAVREALAELADKMRTGEMDMKHAVSLKYLADGLALTTRDTAVAFPAPARSARRSTVKVKGTKPLQLVKDARAS